jgi:hypothetical protein
MSSPKFVTVNGSRYATELNNDAHTEEIHGGGVLWSSKSTEAILTVEERRVGSRVRWLEANSHFRSRDFGSAISAYTSALDGVSQTNRVTILSNRAECYLRMGLKQQAKTDVENALRLNPGHEKSQSRLKRCGGKTYTRCRDARAERDGGRCCLASMSISHGGRNTILPGLGTRSSSFGDTHTH